MLPVDPNNRLASLLQSQEEGTAGHMGQQLGSDMDMFAAKLSQIVHADFHSQAVQTPLDLGMLFKAAYKG